MAWHWKQLDLAAGYAFWAPSGDFDATQPASPGKGFWSHMLTLGGTVYPTEDKAWSASALSRFEFHTENRDLQITPGESISLEWGIGRAITSTIEAGVVGYCAWQVGDDSGAGLPAGPRVHDQVYAVGPEISAFCPKLALGVSARYLLEFGAKDRPEGNAFVLTLTKRW